MIRFLRLFSAFREMERAVVIANEARQNIARSHEFLQGQAEALKEAHAREIDTLKRMIDYFSPTLAHRTVFGLAPEQPAIAPESVQSQGAYNRRGIAREMFEQYYQSALSQMPPNPNNEAPADFTTKQ